MKFSTPARPISYLKSDTDELVKRLGETREPLLLTQDGEPKLVVMDFRTYEEQEQALALLKVLALGNNEIDAGLYRPAEDVFRSQAGHCIRPYYL